MDQLPGSSPSAPDVDEVPLRPVGEPAPVTVPARPTVLTELRRRAPGMWATVRHHPGVAAASRAVGLSGSGRRAGGPAGVASDARWTRTTAAALAASASASASAAAASANGRIRLPGFDPGGPLAEVIPLPVRRGGAPRPVPMRGAVVIDLARYRVEGRISVVNTA